MQIIAAGPFTTADNLLFEPLAELLAYAKRKQPQLLILVRSQVKRCTLKVWHKIILFNCFSTLTAWTISGFWTSRHKKGNGWQKFWWNISHRSYYKGIYWNEQFQPSSILPFRILEFFMPLNSECSCKIMLNIWVLILVWLLCRLSVMLTMTSCFLRYKFALSFAVQFIDN